MWFPFPQKAKVEERRLHRLDSTLTTTVGSTLWLFNNYKFEGRVKIHQITIYAVDEENAGFIVFYYSYNPPTSSAGPFFRVAAQGRVAIADKPLIIEPHEVLNVAFMDPKIIGLVHATLYYEVIP